MRRRRCPTVLRWQPSASAAAHADQAASTWARTVGQELLALLHRRSRWRSSSRFSTGSDANGSRTRRRRSPATWGAATCSARRSAPCSWSASVPGGSMRDGVGTCGRRPADGSTGRAGAREPGEPAPVEPAPVEPPPGGSDGGVGAGEATGGSRGPGVGSAPGTSGLAPLCIQANGERLAALRERHAAIAVHGRVGRGGPVQRPQEPPQYRCLARSGCRHVGGLTREPRHHAPRPRVAPARPAEAHGCRHGQRRGGAPRASAARRRGGPPPRPAGAGARPVRPPAGT
jgi:hypothetical protein